MFFSKIGEKSETGGMHHGLRGDGRPWSFRLSDSRLSDCD